MRLACMLSLALCLSACQHVVEVDVDCSRLCLGSPGPTLPGLGAHLPAVLDAAILGPASVDAGTAPPLAIRWTAALAFDEVLRQLPSSAVDLSADVRISSVHLTSTTDLSFVGRVAVFLSRGGTATDGGVANAGSRVDANGPGCLASPVEVAHFVRSGGEIGSSDLELVITNPQDNVFDCLQDAPARFDVDMGLLAAAYPAMDVPLRLRTCVGVHASAGYP